MDDVRRMLAVKAGDAGAMAAFEALVLAWQGPLTSFFDRLLADRALAEEYAQEVFCRIYQHREDYEPRASFATYLYRIARNLWVDHVRRKASHPRAVSLDHPSGAAVAAQGPAPSDAMAARELAAAVRTAVASLPDRLRLVYVMGEAQGMSYAQISDVLEIPVGTVKSRMHAAVMHLRGALAGWAEASPP